MAGKTKERILNYLRSVAENRRKDVLAQCIGGVLLFLSLLYGFVLTVRFFMYRAGILSRMEFLIPVISVGNVTVGGTGKTPLVELIAGMLTERRYKTAVVSRGYAAKNTASGIIADETLMLRKSLPKVPVIINEDRKAAIKEAQDKYKCGCVILDDALQNLKIIKSLEIVCIDCRDPFGNGQVLPRGMMRVPFIYLRQADIFVLTHYDAVDDKGRGIIPQLRRYSKDALICRGRHVPVSLSSLRGDTKIPLQWLKGKKVALLCAIARPENFEQTVIKLGADVEMKSFYPDHYFFSKNELNGLFDKCRADSIEAVVTTAKDEPRLKAVLGEALPGIDILVLGIKLKIDENEKRFSNSIYSLFAA